MSDTSIWRGLHNPVYRRLWIASVISGCCVSAQDTAATWIMNALTGSSFLISAMSTVAALPFFFFTLKLEQVLHGSELGGIDWKVNLGIAILGIVLIVSIAAVLLFLVLPLALSPETRSGSSLRVLYFIAIGRHPAFGYTDEPPLIPLLAHGMDSAFGHSLVWLRVPPALAGAGVVLVTGLITREFGGGRAAQLLAIVIRQALADDIG